MLTHIPEALQSELAKNIVSEYRKLLSINVSNADAERLIIDHFSKSIVLGSPQEAYIWLVLALCEWELGRLSLEVKETAQKWATCMAAEFPQETIPRLLATLDSPMPEAKKIRPPCYVSHCPWPVGSLLAYRIISSNRPHITQSPFYSKYVLLRIIMIKRHPISQLAPDAGWSESMLVGLYRWIGESIPDPGIVKDLSFTAISQKDALLSQPVFSTLPRDKTPDTKTDVIQQTVHRATAERIETCCDLSWNCARGVRRDDVFTFIECDPSFGEAVPPFFKTEITDYSMCHSIPFDAVLVNRFTQLMHNL